VCGKSVALENEFLGLWRFHMAEDRRQPWKINKPNWSLHGRINNEFIYSKLNSFPLTDTDLT